jgi:hypothetical protein
MKFLRNQPLPGRRLTLRPIDLLDTMLLAKNLNLTQRRKDAKVKTEIRNGRSGYSVFCPNLRVFASLREIFLFSFWVKNRFAGCEVQNVESEQQKVHRPHLYPKMRLRRRCPLR